MSETNFRALCAELLGELQALRRAVADEIGCPSPEPSVVHRANAALAQPEPVVLTRPDCFDFAMDFLGSTDEAEVRNYIERLESTARAVLARCGTPAIEPVPVSERLPEDADVNKFGQVWWFDSPEDNWILDTCEEGDLEWLNLTRYTHWLPCTAIPTPTREENFNG